MKLRRREIERALGRKIVTAWSEFELNYLKLNYGRTPTKEIAKVLNRSISGVRYMARELDLVKPRWSEEQESFLLENKDLSRAEIAKALGKSVNAVNQKLKRLRKACIS